MNILNKISKSNLKMNKKRTIGTLIGIILSTALICASAGLFTSFKKTILQNAINETGYFHLSIYNINNNDLKKLEENRKIEEIKPIYNLGVSEFKEDNDNPYIYIYSTNFIEELSFSIIEGRKPNNNKEIIINQKLSSDSNYKVGDTITLNIGERQTSDGSVLNESNPYLEENEEQVINTHEEKYKIVGIFSKSGYNYNYYALTTKEKNEKINAYISLKNPKNYKSDIPLILDKNNYTDVQERNLENSKYNYDINSELLRWEVFAFSDSTITMIYTVLIFVICVIILTSIYYIKNSFAISTNEKIKMYGMLSSIGSTKKQIRKCITNEALYLGLIGIPIGIISGLLADYILIKVVNHILNGNLFNNLDKIIFNISLISIIFSIILAYITIYISSLSSGIKASKVSPIANLKNINEIKIKKEKLHTPKFITVLFKTGGTLAYKNLKRSKRKYKTTIISLTISIFTFITMNSFLTQSFNLTNKYYNEYDYNIEIFNLDNLTEEQVTKISEINNIKQIYTLYELNEDIKIKDKSKLNKNDIFPLENDCEINTDCKDEYYTPLKIIALDTKTFQSYLKKLKIDYDKTKEKGILIDEYKYFENGESKTTRFYKYKNNDKIEGELNGLNIEIEIALVSTIKPFGIENSYYSGGYLIINKDDFIELDLKRTLITIDSSTPNEVIKEIKKINNNLSITNYEEIKKEDHAMRLVVSIFLYGFITVITLIGVTNIFNTINSNMELRSKEFAILKSIGMTKKEFKRMINLETLFYCIKSLLYGIILGIIGSLILNKGFSEKDIEYTFPSLAIIISIIFVTLIVYIIMRFSINRINKQNTIETIRNENI